MRQFVYGSRFDQCIIDLDKTAEMLRSVFDYFNLKQPIMKNCYFSLTRQALNFTAHIAHSGGIIMFVCRQPNLVHMVDKTAREVRLIMLSSCTTFLSHSIVFSSVW